MKLIKPSYEILEQGPGLQGIYKQIELAGRTCYKSLDKITDDSAEDFVNRMITSKHYAMLEHGTVYLRDCRNLEYENNIELVEYPHTLDKYSTNPYSKVRYTSDCIYVTTNYRVLAENGWLKDLKYLCEPTEYHEKRVTVRFTTDRGISHEFVRHKILCVA